jgi:hypothetical protein
MKLIQLSKHFCPSGNITTMQNSHHVSLHKADNLETGKVIIL